MNVRDAPENSSETDPIEVRVNSSNVDLQNFISNCFFCGGEDCEQKLHRCEAVAVNQKVRRIAHELGDNAIMSKLSEGRGYDSNGSDASCQMFGQLLQ